MRISNGATRPPQLHRQSTRDELLRDADAGDGWRPSAHWQSRVQCSAKRCIDLIGATLAMLISLPVFVTAAFIVWATSPGPILLRQTRIGKDERPFTIYKFRTMYTGVSDAVHREYYAALVAGSANATNGAFKLINDKRITPVGRVLRKLSIDELPQLINVFKGQMSLVGPRPPLPYEVALYDAAARRRLAAKPGMTGLWQVRGRTALNFHQMVELDLEYISSWSIALDVRILWLTPLAVLKAVGAG